MRIQDFIMRICFNAFSAFPWADATGLVRSVKGSMYDNKTVKSLQVQQLLLAVGSLYSLENSPEESLPEHNMERTKLLKPYKNI